MYVLLQKGEFIPPCVSVGEKILLPEYGGTKINFDDKVMYSVRTSPLFYKICYVHGCCGNTTVCAKTTANYCLWHRLCYRSPMCENI